ncbi:MAG: SLC13 family permease [Nitrospinales bacterium]
MTALPATFKKRLFVILLGLGLFALVLAFPLPQGMSAEAQRMLAVVLLMGVWWIGEGVPVTVTAFLPLVLFPLLGIMSSKEVAPNYTNHLVFLFLGGLMMAQAMEKWNFHKRIALRIIAAVGAGPRRIVLGFMAATAFLSMWISNTATTMMMLPVAMAVVRQVASAAVLNGERNWQTEQQVRQSFGLVLMLAVAYSASIGGVGTLIGTPPNIVLVGFYKKLFPDAGEIGFLQWMLMAIPVVILFLPMVWWYLCRVVSPIPLAGMEFAGQASDAVHHELRALGAMSRAEKYIAVVFFSAAVLWIFRKPVSLGAVTFPGWSGWLPYPHMVHDATVAMAMGLLLFILPLDFRAGVLLNGKREFFVLDWKTIQQGTPWGILFLFGGGFALAAGFTGSGLDQWIGLRLAAIAGLPQWLVIFLVCLAITFLTELTSNTATTTMILPILAAAAVAAQIHPLMLMAPAALAASFAFMLPVATPPNAIVFGSGWVTIPEMSRAGLALNFIGAALITVLASFLIRGLFL